MEYEEEWWSPVTPYYQEARTVELINLFQQELLKARAMVGESRTGYQYADGTTIKIYWGTDMGEAGQDVVYELQGADFYLECRMTGPDSDDDAMLTDHTWGDIVEEYLWIDSVEGDEQATAWLRNPPERSIIDYEAYRAFKRPQS